MDVTEHSGLGGRMEIDQLASKVLSEIPDRHPDGAFYPLGVPGLFAIRHFRPMPVTATVYSPVAGLVLQGQKTATLGNSDREVTMDKGDCVVVSHTVPAYNRVNVASPEHPYVILVAELDLALVRSLVSQIQSVDDTGTASALNNSKSQDQLTYAFSRLFGLHSNQLDTAILLNAAKTELHYRLLTSKQGSTLRNLLDLDSAASRILKAVEQIRHRLEQDFSIDDLAREAGMGKSTFFVAFKDAVGSTPVQYIKDLRLLEARRLLTLELERVAQASSRVGYRNLPHFSRDYKRKFGESPSETRKRAMSNEISAT